VVEGDTFEVLVESRSATTLVRVTGDLDLATVPKLERALASRPRDTSLVIDLGNCTFVDSSCVRSLVGAAREAREAGTKAAIVATEPGVLRVLEITGVDTLASVHRSLDDALAS
jgi:anti-sigma B factor antagonist